MKNSNNETKNKTISNLQKNYPSHDQFAAVCKSSLNKKIKAQSMRKKARRMKFAA